MAILIPAISLPHLGGPFDEFGEAPRQVRSSTQLFVAEPAQIMKETCATMVQTALAVTDDVGRSHSSSFDQRRRPETLRTAMATAFF